jgi:hypothetical protein
VRIRGLGYMRLFRSFLLVVAVAACGGRTETGDPAGTAGTAGAAGTSGTGGRNGNTGGSGGSVCENPVTCYELCTCRGNSSDVCLGQCTGDGGAGGGRPYCGNGILEGNEVCDGTNLAGNTCGSVTFGARPYGFLSCTFCNFDMTNCTGFPSGGAGGGGGFGGGGGLGR